MISSHRNIQEADAVINRRPQQLAHRFVEGFQNGVKMLLVFSVAVYVKPYPDGIAGQGAAKDCRIPCGAAQGVVLCHGILFAKACGGADDFHKLLLWRIEHIGSERVILQKLQGCLGGNLAEDAQICGEGHLEFRIQLQHDGGLQVLEIILIPDKVTQVNDRVLRDDGCLEGNIKPDLRGLFGIKFVIMQFPYVHVCGILSDDRINDRAVKPLIT